MIIDNLTTESNQRWVFFTDRVMGGVSSGSLKLVEEKGDKFYKMTGDVSTANNGGFIQFRADLRSLNLNDNKDLFFVKGCRNFSLLLCLIVIILIYVSS